MDNRLHIRRLLWDHQDSCQVNHSHHLRQYLSHSWNNRPHQRLWLVNSDTYQEPEH